MWSLQTGPRPTNTRNGSLAQQNSAVPIADDFRRSAYAHADWIAQYFETVRDHRVLPLVQPGEFAASLPKTAPEQGESLDAIFSDFQSTVMPALTLWNHPKFFAWFSVSSTPPSVLADFLSAAVNVNAMLWKRRLRQLSSNR